MIAKYGIHGNLIWESSLIDTSIYLIIPSFITDDSSNTYTFFHENNLHFEKLYLSKTNKYGQIVWTTSFETTQSESFGSSHILLKDDGTIYIVGEYILWSGSTGDSQVFFLKYDKNGNLINYVKKDLSESTYSVQKADLDKNNNLYVLVTSQSIDWLTNFHVAKFDFMDEFEFEIIYDSYNEEPVDFAIIDENDLVITGRYNPPNKTGRILTTRFSDKISSVIDLQIPDKYNLYQNYPNPFNPSTIIRYSIPNVETHRDASLRNVSLKVYDILGREITTLVNEEKSPGIYEVEFNASKYASGVYFYQLLVSALQSKDGKAGSYIDTKKMILIK